MANETILVVDDEEEIIELLEYNLAKNGYDVLWVTSGEEAVKAALTERPHLVILDLMLPGIDGLEVYRILKGSPRTAQIPIVMLTAKGEEADIVAGLELGADDYITKPFSPRVLLARIKAVLRRKHAEPVDEKAVVKIHNITVDPVKHEVLVEGKRVDVTATEFKILDMMLRHPGWVFTRSRIIDAVRGEGYPVTDRSVDVHIVSLRRKMGEAGGYIDTVRGVGYRFKE